MTQQQSVRCGRIGLGIDVAFAWLLCAASAYAQTQAPTTAAPVGVVVAEKQPVARLPSSWAGSRPRAGSRYAPVLRATSMPCCSRRANGCGKGIFCTALLHHRA